MSLPECRITSVPANSGTPYVIFSAKVMLKFSVNFSMTLLKIGHMEYPNLQEQKLIDISANSRASRGTAAASQVDKIPK